MCLAIPMQVITINGYTARCSARGIERDVSLFMLQDEPVVIGDFVMIQLDYAIQKVSEEDARISWELFDQILGESSMESSDLISSD